MANVFQIKRRAANAPAFDPTRMDLSQSGGSDRGYKIGEKVTYNGSTYVALHNNDAISPTSAEYWQNLNI